MIGACIGHCYRHNILAFQALTILLKHPLSWTILLFVTSCLISVFTSIDPAYSLKQFLDEIVLKICLYFSLTIFCATIPPNIKWLNIIVKINIIFLLIYFYVMLQWILMPTHPVFIPDHLIITNWRLQDIIFRYGNLTTLIHDTKHTGFFILLGMAAAAIPALWIKKKKNYLILFLFNFITLITTVRRSHMIASLIGISIAVFFKPKLLKRASILLLSAFISLLLTGGYLYTSGKLSYLVHEDWNKVLTGKIEAEGSVFLRIISMKLYGAEMMKHPFQGVGLGKKNIKEAYPEIKSQIKLGHPHNIFINIACETGLQGAISLLLLIGAQAFLLIKAYRNTSSTEIQLILITGIVYICMFWIAQMATYGFRHGIATLYWLFTAIPTGYALAEHKNPEKAAA